MKIAYFIKKKALKESAEIPGLLRTLENGGCATYDIASGLQEGTDMLLCFGGDGTLLSAAGFALQNDIPIMGVNMGRMGFLSENRLEDIAPSLLNGTYTVVQRTMLCARLLLNGSVISESAALNDVSVRRASAGMLGVEVSINGEMLPTYWADGVLISSASGSTAYNLSVGGPICAPDSKVFILSPIAPHNLNMRPLIVPESATIELSIKNDGKVAATLALDNNEFPIPAGAKVVVQRTSKSLKTANAGKSNFIDALQSKLFWGEDVRNQKQDQ